MTFNRNVGYVGKPCTDNENCDEGMWIAVPRSPKGLYIDCDEP